MLASIRIKRIIYHNYPLVYKRYLYTLKIIKLLLLSIIYKMMIVWMRYVILYYEISDGKTY
jgi:hypothetical protein